MALGRNIVILERCGCHWFPPFQVIWCLWWEREDSILDGLFETIFEHESVFDSMAETSMEWVIIGLILQATCSDLGGVGRVNCLDLRASWNSLGTVSSETIDFILLFFEGLPRRTRLSLSFFLTKDNGSLSLWKQKMVGEPPYRYSTDCRSWASDCEFLNYYWPPMHLQHSWLVMPCVTYLPQFSPYGCRGVEG